MKILISARSKNKKDIVESRFGRCEFFQIYENSIDTMNVVENEGKNQSGGAGISAAQQAIDIGAQVIITGNLGPNAYELIEKAGIEAYKAGGMEIENAIEKYRKGELEAITVPGTAHHGI